MIRRWEKVKGYDNYFITDLGEVFSKYAQLKPCRNSTNGYMIVSLSEKNKKTSKAIHTLVAESFIGPCPENCVIHHKDKNPLNNCLKNLEWISRSEHGKIHPRTPGGKRNKEGIASDNPWRGERVHSAKLTEIQVKEIRRLWLEKTPNYSLQELSKTFNVTMGTLSKIINRKTWAYLM